MALTVQDVMTPDPIVLDAGASVQEAARCMRDDEIGDVLVSDGGTLRGIVTDRDIVVRGVATGVDSREMRLADVCSGGLTTVSPADPVDRAVELMRDHALRRLPVVRDGRPVGIVSLGDLAIEEDPSSALADISVAPSNS